MIDFNGGSAPWTLDSLNARLETLVEGEVLRIEGLSNEIYHASNGISTSMIKKFIECPYLYFCHFIEKSVEFEDKPHFAFGDAGHTTILEPGEFDNRYVRQPDSISTRAGAKWESFKLRADSAGKKVLSGSQWDAMPKLKQAIDRHPTAMRYLTGGFAEVSYYIRDDETGFIIKCRTDYEIHGPNGLVLSDLKTSDTANPKFIQGKFKKLGYHIQDAVYSYITGAKGFLFVVVESGAPHIVTAPVIMGEDVKRLGFLKFREALRGIKECTISGVWPMYAIRPFVIGLNKFEQDELEKMENEL